MRGEFIIIQEKIPQGWIETTLDDLLIRITNGSSAKQFDEKVGFPITRIETIWDEKIDLNRVKYIKENSIEFVNKYSLQFGDILLSHINSDNHLGKTAIFESPNLTLIHGINLLLLRPTKLISSDFLNYVFKHYRLKGEFINLAQRAVNQSSINQRKLKALKIILPPLPEQRRIVSKIEELFSDLDKGIEQLKTAQQQLKVYRQAVLKWAFEGRLTEEWRKTHQPEPAENLLDQIKAERSKQYQRRLKEWEETVKSWEENGKKGKRPTKPKMPKNLPPLADAELAELPELPEGWCWGKVNSLTLGVEYGTSVKSKNDGKVPVLRMGNVKNFKFDWDDLVYTNNEIEIKKYLLRNNDVLFNRTNSPELVGKTAIYHGEMPAIFAGYLIRLNQIPEIVNSKYLNYFLNCKIAKDHGNKVKTDGVNQSNINGEKLVNYPFPYCPLPEQHQIVQEIETRLSVCDNLEATISEALEKAEALRQSILKRAFEGRLVPQDPNDPPASALLEQIRVEKAKLDTMDNKRIKSKNRRKNKR